MEEKIFELVSAGVVVSPSLIAGPSEVIPPVEIDDYAGLDDLLIQASQMVEECPLAGPSEVIPPAVPRRFAGSPQRNGEIELLKKAGIPENTRKTTKWAENVWFSWAVTRSACLIEEAEKLHVLSSDLSEMSTDNVAFWLPKFVVEVRKENGEFYPPNSLYALCCALQRDIRTKNGRSHVNFFTDAAFNQFRQVLDSQMKVLQSTGKFENKQSAIITEEIEDKLWEEKFLGDHTPQVLLNTVFYCIGLCFALRGGEEHRRLRHDPPQIKLYEPEGSVSYLVYTEDMSKTNQGGLLHRHRDPKKVTHYANRDSPQRCLVRLFKLYNQRCPHDRPNAFYLKPLKHPKVDIWFQKVPLGHNTLSSMISKIMQSAGIPGCFTNHSLRSTATTRLFHASLDEQLIMLRTGHSSLRGVRAYKRMCEQQQQLTSDILNSKKKKQNEEPVDENDSSIVNMMSSSQSSVHHQEKTYDYKQAIPFTLNISSSNVTFNITHSSN